MRQKSSYFAGGDWNGVRCKKETRRDRCRGKKYTETKEIHWVSLLFAHDNARPPLAAVVKSPSQSGFNPEMRWESKKEVVEERKKERQKEREKNPHFHADEIARFQGNVQLATANSV